MIIYLSLKYTLIICLVTLVIGRFIKPKKWIASVLDLLFLGAGRMLYRDYVIGFVSLIGTTFIIFCFRFMTWMTKMSTFGEIITVFSIVIIVFYISILTVYGENDDGSIDRLKEEFAEYFDGLDVKEQKKRKTQSRQKNTSKTRQPRKKSSLVVTNGTGAVISGIASDNFPSRSWENEKKVDRMLAKFERERIERLRQHDYDEDDYDDRENEQIQNEYDEQDEKERIRTELEEQEEVERTYEVLEEMERFERQTRIDREIFEMTERLNEIEDYNSHNEYDHEYSHDYHDDSIDYFHNDTLDDYHHDTDNYDHGTFSDFGHDSHDHF